MMVAVLRQVRVLNAEIEGERAPLFRPGRALAPQRGWRGFAQQPGHIPWGEIGNTTIAFDPQTLVCPGRHYPPAIRLKRRHFLPKQDSASVAPNSVDQGLGDPADAAPYVIDAFSRQVDCRRAKYRVGVDRGGLGANQQLGIQKGAGWPAYHARSGGPGSHAFEQMGQCDQGVGCERPGQTKRVADAGWRPRWAASGESPGRVANGLGPFKEAQDRRLIRQIGRGPAELSPPAGWVAITCEDTIGQMRAPGRFSRDDGPIDLDPPGDLVVRPAGVETASEGGPSVEKIALVIEGASATSPVYMSLEYCDIVAGPGQ